jgi:hypothetical protein
MNNVAVFELTPLGSRSPVYPLGNHPFAERPKVGESIVINDKCYKVTMVRPEAIYIYLTDIQIRRQAL